MEACAFTWELVNVLNMSMLAESLKKQTLVLCVFVHI